MSGFIAPLILLTGVTPAQADPLPKDTPTQPPQPTPAVPPIPPDAPPPEIDPILAILTLKDGTTVIFTEGQVKSYLRDNLPKTASLPRTDYLGLKYKLFHDLLLSNKDKLENLEIKDPGLYALWNLDMIISQPLGEESIQQLEQFITNLPAKVSDKPYLMLMFTQHLWGAGRISEEKARENFIALAESHSKEIVFQEALCEFYISLNRFDLAASRFIKFMKTMIPLSEEEKKAKDLSLVYAMLRKGESITDATLWHKLGDYLRLWAENEADPKRSRNLILAAQSCYYKALSTDLSDESQLAGYLKLSEVHQKLAQLETDPAAAREHLSQAIQYSEDALRVSSDNPTLLLRLGDLYFAKASQEEDEDEVEKLLEKVKDNYEKAFLLVSSPPKEIYLRLVTIYAQLELYDKALSTVKKALEQDPKDPLLYALLGDLYFASGQVTLDAQGQSQGDSQKLTEALNAYKTAFEKAKELNDPLVLSSVYQKLTHLRLRAQMELASKPSSNILKRFLRMGGDLFYYANPINMISHVIRPPKSPRHTKEELEKFLGEADRLYKEAWQSTVGSQSDINFYLLNLMELTKLSQVLEEQIRETDKQMIAPELVEGLKESKKEVDKRIQQNLKAVASLTREDEAWAKAIAQKQSEVIIGRLKIDIQNYLLLNSFLENKDLAAAVRKKLSGDLEKLWDKLSEEIDDALDLAEDEKITEIPFALFQFLGQAGEMLIKSQKSRKNEELAKFMLACLKTQVSIARDKKDFQSLLELAKGEPKDLALESLTAALEVAKETKKTDDLLGIAQLVYSMSLEVGNNSEVLTRVYNEIAVSACQAALKIAQEIGDSKTQVACMINLWRLGRYQKAIAAQEHLLEVTDDKDIKIQLYADLAYMHLALDEKKEALVYFRKALALSPKDKNLAEEISHLEKGTLPPDVILESNSYFSPRQLRAVAILYSHWLPDADIKTVGQGLIEFHQAHGYRTKVLVETTPSQIPVFRFNIMRLSEIAIEGNNKTKREVIIRELEFAGLKVGDNYDQKKIQEAVVAAQNRLQTFLIQDWKIEEKNGKAVLKLVVEEVDSSYFQVGGGGGNLEANFGAGLEAGNLLGGGEKLGVMVNYQKFFGNGYRGFALWGGRIYYKDPYLFAWSGKPVSWGLSLERSGRLNYFNGHKEIATGGSVTFGLHLTPRTSVSLTPSLYQITDNSTDFYRHGYRVDLTHDHRDNWVFPSSGYYASTFVEPGLYFGDGGRKGFISTGIELRKYFALPADFSIMVGGKGALGFNLSGGDQFFLGNGFIRSNNRVSNYGPAALGTSLELKTPVLNLEYLKLQPYLFADAGCAFKSPSRKACGVGTGGGMRVLIIGIMLNLYFGWPDGFGFRFGPPGQD